MLSDEQRVLATQGFDAHYGLELIDADGDEVRSRLEVRAHHKQPAGLVHGGLYASIAESMSSLGTVVGTGRAAAGMSNHTSFLRPVTGGSIQAVSRPRHKGRTTWVWETEFHDDAGRLCALSRVTIAVLEARVSPDSGS